LTLLLDGQAPSTREQALLAGADDCLDARLGSNALIDHIRGAMTHTELNVR
jgi:hypothetical protein